MSSSSCQFHRILLLWIFLFSLCVLFPFFPTPLGSILFLLEENMPISNHPSMIWCCWAIFLPSIIDSFLLHYRSSVLSSLSSWLTTTVSSSWSYPVIIIVVVVVVVVVVRWGEYYLFSCFSFFSCWKLGSGRWFSFGTCRCWFLSGGGGSYCCCCYRTTLVLGETISSSSSSSSG